MGYCSFIEAVSVGVEMYGNTNHKWVPWTVESQQFSMYQKESGDGEKERILKYQFHTKKSPPKYSLYTEFLPWKEADGIHQNLKPPGKVKRLL